MSDAHEDCSGDRGDGTRGDPERDHSGQRQAAYGCSGRDARPSPRPDPGPGPGHHPGRDPARTWALLAPAPAVLVAGYFLLPPGVLGPQRPVLSWTVFLVALALIAVLLLKHIRDVLLDRPHTHPVTALVLLMCLTVVVFATAYLSLSRHPGEFHGLHTHLDALYFTFVTLATVGYGDITPHGQSARLAALLQIVYTLVFLTAGATAITRHLRNQAGQRVRGRRRER